MLRLRLTVWLVTAIGMLGGAAYSQEPDGKKAPGEKPPAAKMKPISLREATALLKMPVATKDFSAVKYMKFGKVMDLLNEKLQAKKINCPIVIDFESFKKENPDAPSLLDTDVRIPPDPPSVTLYQLLEGTTSRFATNNAAIIYANGAIVVTTKRVARDLYARPQAPTPRGSDVIPGVQGDPPPPRN